MKEGTWIKNFLDKLSKANKEEFGDKPLDCCKLNKDDKYEKTNDNRDEKSNRRY